MADFQSVEDGRAKGRMIRHMRRIVPKKVLLRKSQNGRTLFLSAVLQSISYYTGTLCKLTLGSQWLAE